MSHNPRLLALRTQPLTGSDLHIWAALLSGSPDELAYFHSLLNAEEKARAERFYFERDRNRYIFGRGILRTLLAGYLGIEAAEIRMTYGPQRKPELESLPHKKTLQFNLAHSNEWAAYIFGWDRPLGIDLEYVRPLPDVDDLAKRFFSPRESKLIHSLSGDQKWDTFFKIWTCKEAILKAHGSGLTLPLDQFEISLDANGAVTLASVGAETTQLAKCHLEIVELVAGYRSAIASMAETGRVVSQRFVT